MYISPGSFVEDVDFQSGQSLTETFSDKCIENPCQNSGRCSLDSAAEMGFTCFCKEGWTGSLCESSNLSSFLLFTSKINACNGNDHFPAKFPHIAHAIFRKSVATQRCDSK